MERMEFACTKLPPEKIIRCAFGLTKQEFTIFLFFCSSKNMISSKDIQEHFASNLASVQRALKKLHDNDLIERKQLNLEHGGYEYFYSSKSRAHLRKLLRDRLDFWVHSVEQEVQTWTKKTL